MAQEVLSISASDQIATVVMTKHLIIPPDDSLFTQEMFATTGWTLKMINKYSAQGLPSTIDGGNF